jgi:cytochrome c biogenesis protein CcdA
MIALNGLFAFLAGGLSILSPCTLPLLPVVFGAATARHPWAPVALMGGLVVSFTGLGLFVATVGFSLGLDSEVLRLVGAGALVAFGSVLGVPWLEKGFARGAAACSSWLALRTQGFAPTGPWGHAGLGVILGVIWTPCTGPTLGAAALLAAQGRDLPHVALTMLGFGLGAGLPLTGFGLVSRALAARWRSPLGAATRYAKAGLGGFAVLAGLAILTGLDRTLEAALVHASPDWLLHLTTRY